MGAEPLHARDLWTVTGVMLGFQITLFKWRLEREAGIGDKKTKVSWLVPSDYLSIAGMLVFVFGVILLPIVGLCSDQAALFVFGVGVLLFVGQALGLAGHYELYNRHTVRKPRWFPLQEKIVVVLTLLVVLLYSVYFMKNGIKTLESGVAAQGSVLQK